MPGIDPDMVAVNRRMHDVLRGEGLPGDVRGVRRRARLRLLARDARRRPAGADARLVVLLPSSRFVRYDAATTNRLATTTDDTNHAHVTTVRQDAAERAVRRGVREPPADAAGGAGAAAGGRAVQLPADGPQSDAEDRADHPRGDGPRGRPGSGDAGGAAGGAVGGVRPSEDDGRRALPPARPPRPRVRARPDARGGDGRPVQEAGAELPRHARDGLPDPDQGA